MSRYYATMVPWLWLLKKTTDSRIFQNLSVPDIIQKIFTEKGLLDYRMALSDSYANRIYCVQYQETDFNFISRLMEEEGIFYFFTHKQGKHVLVMTDDPSEHKNCPHQGTARYQTSIGGTLDENVITGFTQHQKITPNMYTVNAFNFKTPHTDLKVAAPGQKGYAERQLEIYDHHQEQYEKPGQGDRISNLCMQANEAVVATFSGTGNCRTFAPGYRFTLQDHFRSDLCDKAFVLTKVKHVAKEEGSYRTGGEQNQIVYENQFECIPFDVPFRPLQKTRKPRVHGSQTAIVTGPPGEEIHTDEFGRVKVQFHWDREGQRDDKTSCWVRVSQVWAGASWGAMYIPRIGHEVIVDFLEGDPDQPIVIGRVYHGTNMPPYTLPAEKTKSTIKSNSTIGGGGSNELRFEDKKGTEEVYLHGQKDWTILIENDKNQTVGHDETHHVKNNRTKNVDVDQKETIGNNKTIQVGVNHEENIGSNMDLTVGSNKTINVGQNHTETIGSNMSLKVASDQTNTIGANQTNTIGDNLSENIGSNASHNIGGNMSVSVSKNKTETVTIASAETVGAAKAVTVGGAFQVSVGGLMNTTVGLSSSEQVLMSKSMSAGKTFTITCGKAKIVLNSSGEIEISGTKVFISGDIDLNKA